MKTNLVLHIRFLCVKLFLIVCVTPAYAAKTGDLERRVERLEKRQNEMRIREEEGRGKVHTFISERISLGGFFETGVRAYFGPDTETQASADSHILGINLTADLSERFRFVSQSLIGLTFPTLNPHNNPNHGFAGLPTRREFSSNVVFGAVVAQGYLEYAFSDAFRIEAGLGYVPFGHAFQQREPVLFLRRGGPQFLRSGDARNVAIASPLWSRLHALGTFSVGGGRWGYNVYSLTPLSDTRSLGVGSRVWWSPPGDLLTIGASFQTADRDTDTYVAFGGDAKIEFKRFGVTVEYGRNMPDGGDPWGFYVEPFVKLIGGKVVLFGAVDYADNAVGVTTSAGTSVADPYRRWEYGGGVNWLPIPAVRFRLTFTVNDYVGGTAVVAGQDRDFYQADFSTGIAF